MDDLTTLSRATAPPSETDACSADASARPSARSGWKLARGSDGRTRFTIGQEAFLKISAVEGIVPTPEALRRTSEFDRLGLTAEERRRAIIATHRPSD
jgi:hypothetical protein